MGSDTEILRLSKADVNRALVLYHFGWATVAQVVERLRSIQFDPLSPAGSNHDLVLQARVKDYRVGDWQKTAYQKRLIYDGWDKQACLVPYSGWAVRRVFHQWFSGHFQRVFVDHPHAVDAVIGELTERGPLIPREFSFQEKKDEWRGSWHGPNLTKQTLRALWHTGRVMTHGRRSGHHVYDLTERVVPPAHFGEPPVTEAEAISALLLDRHRGVGLLRPNASAEVWSMPISAKVRHDSINELVERGDLVRVKVEGMVAHAHRDLLLRLDERRRPARVVFLGPLDQVMWDRRMVEHLFGFDYIWEVYKPESERKWGYYVLPVLYGEKFVARMDIWCRNRTLEIRAWHWEAGKIPTGFRVAYQVALARFMEYCGADTVVGAPGVDTRLTNLS